MLLKNRRGRVHHCGRVSRCIVQQFKNAFTVCDFFTSGFSKLGLQEYYVFLIYTYFFSFSSSPPMPSTSSSSLTNEVPKPPAREQPATRPPYTPTMGGQAPHSHQFPRTRKMFDKGPEQVDRDGSLYVKKVI